MAVIQRISQRGLLPLVISTQDRVIPKDKDIEKFAEEKEYIKLSPSDIVELQTKVQELCRNNNPPQFNSVERPRTYNNTPHFKNKNTVILSRPIIRFFFIVICAFLGTFFIPLIGTIIGGFIGLRLYKFWLDSNNS